MIMVDQNLIFKVLIAVALFFVMQLGLFWSKLQSMDDRKLTVQAVIETLERRRDELQMKNWDLERQNHRLQLKMDQFDARIKDRTSLIGSSRNSSTVIYFITPTSYRAAQKADLVRLAQTLSLVPNLFWIIIEDAKAKSLAIEEIMSRAKVKGVHLSILTPTKMKLNDTMPNWKLPRGVLQRNAALNWIRINLPGPRDGIVYFGDDDNTYDVRIFDEMRTIRKAGIWPVGIVGGRLVETPILDADGLVSGFNALWKPDRPFPVDMAAFAVNINLILENPYAAFTYNVARGYQESHFLTSIGISRADLEPKANSCTLVLVWHTRTERIKLASVDYSRFGTHSDLNQLEADAVV